MGDVRKVVYAAVMLAGLTASSAAVAQSGSVHFQFGFSGAVDCRSPFPLSNVPIKADGAGVLNADGSAAVDLTQTAFVLSTKIHFDGRLGPALAPAPGGTAQVRVAGRNGLRLIWHLPNNQLITHINVRGHSCSAQFETRLNPGKREYTLFDGNIYHYCDRPRMSHSSCEVR